jgi:hypothetical protein
VTWAAGTLQNPICDKWKFWSSFWIFHVAEKRRPASSGDGTSCAGHYCFAQANPQSGSRGWGECYRGRILAEMIAVEQKLSRRLLLLSVQRARPGKQSSSGALEFRACVRVTIRSELAGYGTPPRYANIVCSGLPCSWAGDVEICCTIEHAVFAISYACGRGPSKPP